MSLTAGLCGRLRKFETLLDNKHMSTNNIQQASTPDAEICGELRTMSGPLQCPDNLEGPPPTAEERAAMARELDRVAPTPGDKFALMLGRPTPRTDKAEYQVRLGRHRRMVVYPDFARKLERELAEAQDDLEETRQAMKDPELVEIGMIGGNVAIPDRPEFDWVRKLAEARETIGELETRLAKSERARRSLSDATDHLNRRLADLLRKAIPYLEDVTDKGPAGAGWKSPELANLIAAAVESTR